MVVWTLDTLEQTGTSESSKNPATIILFASLLWARRRWCRVSGGCQKPVIKLEVRTALAGKSKLTNFAQKDALESLRAA